MKFFGDGENGKKRETEQKMAGSKGGKQDLLTLSAPQKAATCANWGDSSVRQRNGNSRELARSWGEKKTLTCC